MTQEYQVSLAIAKMIHSWRLRLQNHQFLSEVPGETSQPVELSSVPRECLHLSDTFQLQQSQE